MLRLAPRLTRFHTLAFSPDGRYLLAVGVRPLLGGLLRSQKVALWDLLDPTAEPPPRIDTGLDPMAGFFLPDGRLLGVDSRGGWLAVRPDGTDATRFADPTAWPVERAVVSADGRRLALTGRADVECRRVLRRPGGRDWRANLREEGEVGVGAAFPPGGEVLAALVRGWTASGRAWGVRTYDADTGTFIRWVDAPDDADRLAWSPDGRFLVTAAANRFEVIDPYTWSACARRPAPGLTALAFHPSGAEFLTGDEAGRVKVWPADEWGAAPDLGVGRPPARTFEWGTGPVQALAVSPGGELAAAAGRDGVVVWDAG